MLHEGQSTGLRILQLNCEDVEAKLVPIITISKLMEQQVNSLLIVSDVLFDENYILPKSLYVCIIRYQGDTKEEAMGQGQATRGEESREDEGKKILL